MSIKQFVLSKNKIPLNKTTLKYHDLNDQTNWGTYEEIIKIAKEKDCEVSFLVRDGYFLVDLDHHVTRGEFSKFAQDICAPFIASNCYVEYSRSGEGLHVIGKCDTSRLPEDFKKKVSTLGLEVYTEKRQVAFTGNHISGNLNSDATEALLALLDKYCKREKRVEREESTAPTIDDKILLTKALNKDKFSKLFNADEDFLASAYPSATGKPYDASSADNALMCSLAFWTGRNAAQMERIFNKSKLAERDKWQSRESYRNDVIEFAIDSCKEIYKPAKAIEEVKVFEGEVLQDKNGVQFLGPYEIDKYFKDWTYIESEDCFIHISGAKRGIESFNRSVSNNYIFKINDKDFTKKAAVAFLEREEKFKNVADVTGFYPENRSGEIIYSEDLGRIYNTYRPLKVPMVEGDVEPFLNHVARMLPNEDDQEILLTYMAACAQNQAKKFQWCIVLQGAQGNGKSTMLDIAGKCFPEQYSGEVPQNLIKNHFNSWAFKKFFVKFDEVNFSRDKEATDIMKNIITNEKITVTFKGKESETVGNYIKCMMATNHLGGVPAHENERRYCVLVTNQQTAAEVARDTPEKYIFNFINWLKNEEGYLKIVHYLHNRNLDERFNPAGSCVRAPKGSRQHEVLPELKTLKEQILEDLLKDGDGNYKVVQFDLMKDILKTEFRTPLTNSKFKEILNKIGYFNYRRTTVEGKKLSLYSHVSLGEDPEVIKAAYLAQQ